MKRHSLLVAFTLVVFLAASLSAQAPPEPKFKIGGKVENLTLRDVKGQGAPLYGLGTDSKLRVVMFIATQCPVSNAYNERMAALDKEYGAKGVKFLAVNSNRQEPAAEVGEHAAKHGFGFPVFKDENNVVADVFGASVTPEIYVFDSGWTLRYHGRIDDNQAGARITAPDLRNALDALLAGKPVPAAETKAFGCTIKRVKK
jgi:thiol-disulfide isomerase/thioredoxin